MRSVGFVLDLGRCLGCGACVLACRLENQLPAAVSWRQVLPLNQDRYRGGPAYHFSLSCHHCSRPACLSACPSGAYIKRSDGTVLIRAELCLGCRYCEMACPFGAPSYDESAGVMTKCHLCVHRIDAGLKPACVSACPTGALLFSRPGEADSGPRTELLPTQAGEELVPCIPGFSDPADCQPNIRFIRPRGRIRTRLLQELEKELKP